MTEQHPGPRTTCLTTTPAPVHLRRCWTGPGAERGPRAVVRGRHVPPPWSHPGRQGLTLRFEVDGANEVFELPYERGASRERAHRLAGIPPAHDPGRVHAEAALVSAGVETEDGPTRSRTPQRRAVDARHRRTSRTASPRRSTTGWSTAPAPRL
ncbi:hypothetical protein QJS66_08060 [Kocuria rhizophila]|nr:hypothetical protein QJS66_08060 [Kocuria rhizophila]